MRSSNRAPRWSCLPFCSFPFPSSSSSLVFFFFFLFSLLLPLLLPSLTLSSLLPHLPLLLPFLPPSSSSSSPLLTLPRILHLPFLPIADSPAPFGLLQFRAFQVVGRPAAVPACYGQHPQRPALRARCEPTTPQRTDRLVRPIRPHIQWVWGGGVLLGGKKAGM